MLAINGVTIPTTGTARGVFAFLAAQANTTCTNADTYYPIAGTFTNNPLDNFSLGATAIEYDGVPTRWFLIGWHASLSADAGGTTVHAGIKHNTNVVAASEMGQYIKTQNEVFTFSGSAAVQLSTGDTIQLVAKADGAGDVLTFKHFTTSITEMFN